MRLTTPVAACAALALLAVPSSSLAATTGIGENMRAVKQIEFDAKHQTKKNQGTDIEFAKIGGREYAFAGSYDNGLQIIDITDPENAQKVAVWDCGIAQGDVQVFSRDDLGPGQGAQNASSSASGIEKKVRWFATFTKDGGYSFRANSECATTLKARGVSFPNAANGTFIVELTDPANPKTVSFFPAPQGSHNGTVHPSGKWFYNSNSDLITSVQAAIEIYSLEDVTNPKLVGEMPLKTFPGLGTESHDLTFNKSGTRAYTAALSHAEVIDTTRPDKPISIGTILDPAINVWHQADPVRVTDPILGTRDFLLVEDEVAGAIGTGQCPNGGVHVYDITGALENAPVKVGYWNIDDARGTDNNSGIGTGTLGRCTAHVFQLHEDAAIMNIAYYNGGVRVVDISGLVGVALGKAGVGMKQLGYFRFSGDAASDTWAVKSPRADRKGFYLYGNDQRRGFDVYEYKPTSPTLTTTSDTWMSPGEQLLAAANHEKRFGKPALAALCLFTQDGVKAAATQAGLSSGLVDQLR